MSKETKIFETSVSVEWVAKTISDSQKITSGLKGHNATKIGVGKGFLSYIILLELEWENKNENLPDSVVLKVPTLTSVKSRMETEEDRTKEEIKQGMLDRFLINAHRNEVIAYSIFGDSCPFPMPRSFYGVEIGTDHPGVLIMQDLSLCTATVNLAVGLNLEQVLSVVDALVSLHVWSLNNKEKWTKRDFWTMIKRAEPGQWEDYMGGIIAKIQELNSEYFEGALEKVKWCYENNLLYDHMFMSYKDMGLEPVLVQGDMWTNNLLFEENTDGTISSNLKAILDWQMTHSGAMTEDIGRLLATCCKGKMRHEVTDKVLKFYHDKMVVCMGDKCPFTLAQVKESYERTLPCGATFFLMGVALLTKSPVVEGPDKDEKVDELLMRTKILIDDVATLKDKFKEYM